MPFDSEGMTILHVQPLDDTMDHDLNDGHCWCDPTYDIRHDRVFVVHNDEHARRSPPVAETVGGVVQNVSGVQRVCGAVPVLGAERVISAHE